MRSDDVRPLFEQAVQAHRAGDLRAAIRDYRAVLAERPELVFVEDNLCQALLANGEYAEGFPLYDVRFRRPRNRVERPQLSFPEWQGEPLAGKSLLILQEQGFGDQIMFSRFARRLAESGVAVSLLAPPPLARLFARLPVTLLVAEGALAIPRHDYWVMAGSLPARLGVTLDSIPPADVFAAPEGGPPPAGRGIGVMGLGNKTPDPLRSLPDDALAALLARPGAVDLHPAATGAADFEATAEIIRGLDCVVSIDTAVAHLAGAMGKPCFLMLPFTPDWRWMRDRSDSPWYPTMTLFRQPSPGDWGAPLAAVVAAIEARRTR